MSDNYHKTMKTYKVWLVGESALALAEPMDFEFDISTIEVRNHFFKPNDTLQLIQ